MWVAARGGKEMAGAGRPGRISDIKGEESTSAIREIGICVCNCHARDIDIALVEANLDRMGRIGNTDDLGTTVPAVAVEVVAGDDQFFTTLMGTIGDDGRARR